MQGIESKGERQRTSPVTAGFRIYSYYYTRVYMAIDYSNSKVLGNGMLYTTVCKKEYGGGGEKRM